MQHTCTCLQRQWATMVIVVEDPSLCCGLVNGFRIRPVCNVCPIGEAQLLRKDEDQGTNRAEPANHGEQGVHMTPCAHDSNFSKSAKRAKSLPSAMITSTRYGKKHPGSARTPSCPECAQRPPGYVELTHSSFAASKASMDSEAASKCGPNALIMAVNTSQCG